MSGITWTGLVGFVIASTITGLIGSVIVVSIAPGVLSMLLHILEFGGSGYLGAILSLLVVMFVGAAAFALRQHSPDVYGIVEVVFGAITATLALTQYAAHSSANAQMAKHASDIMPENAKYAFAAFSGLYIIVRGLDNLGKYVSSDSVKKTSFAKY